MDQVAGQACKRAGPGPDNPPCDVGYEELFRDSVGNQSFALCCDPKDAHCKKTLYVSEISVKITSRNAPITCNIYLNE